MTNLVTHQELNDFKAAGTRTIRMPNGTARDVRMPPHYWEIFDALKLLEGFTETDIAKFAEEEVSLQDITFDKAFRACVAHFRNRWTA
jgi:hypothetical protein